MTIRNSLGTGAALWDYDGDGWLDLFLVGNRETSTRGGGALFRNKGDGTFEDRTAGTGLDVPGSWHGCAVGDIDNDGRPDLLITGYGDCRLFLNLGEGRFRDITRGSGIQAPSPAAWGTSAAFADVNRDGLLDLYVGRYVKFGPKDLQLCDYRGVKASCGPKSYDPQQGSLYLNQGSGRFTEVTAEWGLGSQHGKTLGVAFGDVNDDGLPDLYLANDEIDGDLFVNREGRRFENIGALSGAAVNRQGNVQGGMGVDWCDYDRDGKLDLFVTTFQREEYSLYRNSGALIFDPVSHIAGLSNSTRPFVGFGTRFTDVDSDGWPDLLCVAGHIQDNVTEIDKTTRYRQPMQLYRNQGGATFGDAASEAGEPFQREIVGRGLALGDVDNDGDDDAVVTDLEGPPLLLLNSAPQQAKSLQIRLQGSESNRMGLGARVRVITPEGEGTYLCQTGGSYLSAGDSRVRVVLGSAAVADVEVAWPSGRVTRHPRLRAGREVTLRERP